MESGLFTGPNVGAEPSPTTAEETSLTLPIPCGGVGVVAESVLPHVVG